MQKVVKKQTDDNIVAGDNTRSRLIEFVERIEKNEEEKAQVSDVIKSIYAEAKSVGFDVKILRKVINRRKIEAEKRREEDELLDLYECTIENLNEMME